MPLNVVGLIVAMHSMNLSNRNVWMLVVLLFVWNRKEEELMLTVSVNVMIFVLLLNRHLNRPLPNPLPRNLHLHSSVLIVALCLQCIVLWTLPPHAIHLVVMTDAMGIQCALVNVVY